jgi:hypothetical protein
VISPDRRQAVSEVTNGEKVIAPVKNNLIYGSKMLKILGQNPKYWAPEG